MGQEVESLGDEELLSLYEETLKLFKLKKDLPETNNKAVHLRKKLDEIEDELKVRDLWEGD